MLRLSENAAAGYRWTLASIDASRVDMLDEQFYPPGSGLGTAGTRAWTFSPKQVGTTRLELTKSRSWQPEGPNADRYVVDLDIVE